MSPANSEAAKLFVENIKEYNWRVRECVESSWEQEEGDNNEDDDN